MGAPCARCLNRSVVQLADALKSAELLEQLNEALKSRMTEVQQSESGRRDFQTALMESEAEFAKAKAGWCEQRSNDHRV